MTRYFSALAALFMLIAIGSEAAGQTAGGQTTGGQTAAGQNPPLVIEADKALEWDQTKQLYRASGNAMAEQGARRITAGVITAFYSEKQDERDITRIEAEGNVLFTEAGQQARGPRLVYDLQAGSWHISGGPSSVVSSDGTAEAGEAIFYDTEKGEVLLSGGGSIKLQDGRILKGREMRLLLDENNEIDQIQARGQVEVRQINGQLAYADDADYMASTGIAILTGEVRLEDGENILNGQRAEIDFNKGINRMLAGKSGRVSGRFILSGTAR